MAGRKKDERPYRIHDGNLHIDLPRRAYVSPVKAIEKCFSLLFQLKTGNTYIVYDDRSSTAILQVTRKVSGLHFYEDEKGLIDKWVKQLPSTVEYYQQSQ